MRTLFITLSIFLLLFSCKKEEDNSNNNTTEDNPIENSYESYFLFPINTKWVYYNSEANDFDTLTLVKQDTICISADDNPIKIYYYEQKYYHTRFDTLTSDNEFPLGEQGNFNIQITKTGLGILHNKNDYNTYNGLKLVEELSNYKVRNITYTNVKHFNYVNDEDEFYADFYFSKNTGLIKTDYIESSDTNYFEIVEKY